MSAAINVRAVKETMLKPPPDSESDSHNSSLPADLDYIAGWDLMNPVGSEVAAAVALKDVRRSFGRWTGIKCIEADLHAILEYVARVMSMYNARQLPDLIKLDDEEERAKQSAWASITISKDIPLSSESRKSEYYWIRALAAHIATLFNVSLDIESLEVAQEVSFRGLAANAIAAGMTTEFLVNNIIDFTDETLRQAGYAFNITNSINHIRSEAGKALREDAAMRLVPMVWKSGEVLRFRKLAQEVCKASKNTRFNMEGSATDMNILKADPEW